MKRRKDNWKLMNNTIYTTMQNLYRNGLTQWAFSKLTSALIATNNLTSINMAYTTLFQALTIPGKINGPTLPSHSHSD